MTRKITTPEPLVSIDAITQEAIERRPKDRDGEIRMYFRMGADWCKTIYENDRRSHLSRIQELEDQVKALREAGGAMYHFLGSELFGTTYSGHSPLTLVQNWRLLTKPDAASKPSNTNTGS